LVCGDNVEPKEALITICGNMRKADVIVPYHPILPGKSSSRRRISRTYTLLVNLISGYSLQYYNGCALYRRFHVMRWAPYTYGFGFQADLITRLLDEGISYFEVPVNVSHVTKDEGGSPLNFRNFVSIGHTLFKSSCGECGVILISRFPAPQSGRQIPHRDDFADTSRSLPRPSPPRSFGPLSPWPKRSRWQEQLRESFFVRHFSAQGASVSGGRIIGL
jgi:hypothetical protein